MTIYVGNISFKMKENDLNAIFAEFGTVESAKIIRDKISKRSKGYGFVDMVSDTDAENAINTLNEKEVDGRALKVHKANPKTEQ